ncbi:MAG: septum site-determining protein MinC [Chloroflexi bacterium]|jgi:septum site-determining protein MinC|nr:septum site-determining protein MinC [Chloroflexota bacterium]
MIPKIEIKGISEGLLATVGEGDWTEIRQALLELIVSQADFFKGASLTVDVGDHEIKAADLGKLRDQISENNVILRGLISKSPRTEENAKSLGLSTHFERPQPERSGKAFDTSVGGDEAIFVQRTLRSGNNIIFPGHVVIIGDVNPGAEIIAGGNIIIWGRLRGTVHAGASGDETALVCALELAPMQLRIAETVSITPSSKKKPKPEVASLKEGQVVAEVWDIHKSKK